VIRLLCLKGTIQRLDRFIGDKHEVDRDLFVESEFEPGEYLVLVSADWASPQSKYPLVVSLYSAVPVLFNDQTNEFGQDNFELIDKMILAKPPPKEL